MVPPVSPETAISARRPSLAALVVISLLSPMSISIVVPSMPAMQRAFETEFWRVQLTLSLFLAAVAVAQIIIGPLSDRFGRRPVLIGGIALYTAVSLLAVLSPSIEALVGARILQGAGACTGLVLGRAIIRDLYDRRKAASMIGYVTMAFAVGPMFAPLIGGLLQETFDWRGQFWFMAALGAGALAVAVFDVSETNTAPSDRISFSTMLRDFARLLRLPEFLLFSMISGLTAGVFFAFLGGSPYVTEILLGMRPTDYGLWFTIIVVGYSVGNFVSGRFAEQVGVRRMILAGTCCMLAAVLTMGALFGLGHVAPVTLFAPMTAVAVSNGLVLPSAVAGAISVRPRIAGAAAGLSGAVQIGAGALASAIAGVVVAGSATPLPLAGCLIALTAAAMVIAVAIHARRD